MPIVTPHTLSPAFLPLLEAFLESFFWKASQLLRHVPHDVLGGCQNGNPSMASSILGTTRNHKEPCLESREHVNWNAMFGQETLDQV
jgi:hypothetical protein